MTTVNIDGIDFSTERLEEIANKTISEGKSGKAAFTPEAFISLLWYIKELESALQDEVKFVRSLGENESERTYNIMIEHEIPFD